MRENPTLVMQHFSELAASLNTYENRNKSVGASVESIFLHTLPKARVDDAVLSSRIFFRRMWGKVMAKNVVVFF